MQNNPKKISLGFTSQEFTPGLHICQIVGDDDEREDTLLKFLQSGLQAGERVSCFTDHISENAFTNFLSLQGISYKENCESGVLTVSGTREAYFQKSRFDPDRMLNVLAQYYEESVSNGFPGSRVIGEMMPEVQHLEGGTRLLEYEARVSLLLRTHPVTTMCQYDARLFNGDIIMEILKAHPLMVVKGSVVHNPFFLPPEEIIKHGKSGAENEGR